MKDHIYYSEVYSLLKQLCGICAPSNFETARAEFCKEYLINAGYKNVCLDEALNVYCGINFERSESVTVFAAHTDTVFPDTEPMPYREENGRAYCPGIGDDTASLAILLVCAKHFLQKGYSSKDGVIFLCNSCEEGLGNLKGIRTFSKDFEGRIKRFISFDSCIDLLLTECVGSHRYLVEASTPGGHSFNAFGNENAINVLAKIVREIYSISVPCVNGSKTTYNVGEISGGTSVNTIAQNAKMLCEYRSDNVECLSFMQKRFEEIFENAKSDTASVSVTRVGDRPCSSNVNKADQLSLVALCRQVIEEASGVTVKEKSASTDCNIPMSKGIPSVSIGVYFGEKCHTREEWIELESLNTGLKIALSLIEKCL